jgi:sterol desaturase/sphingolipid hydroxylase (fatty acid hydroxylase superfamily)
MTGEQVIVLATPVFLVLIALEFFIGLRRGHNVYRLNDTLSSIGLGMMSQVSGVFVKVFTIGIYSWIHSHSAQFELSADAVWVWILALLLYDFCYYWLHRAGHRVAILWAAHVVHHQSEEYNLSTALRQTSSGALLGWVFYIPMAVVGVPPKVFAVVALIDLLYQFWVHTRLVGSLGWFDRVFCSPSNHRVHHAVNDQYLDKNYGGILVIWDRMFGTFAPERAELPCVYGTRQPLRSWNPIWANLQVYADLWRRSNQATSWRDRLQLWFRPPGWQSGQMRLEDPQAVFKLEQHQRFDPLVSRTRQVLAAALFLGVLNVLAVVLWRAHEISNLGLISLSAIVVVTLWLIGQLGMTAGQALGQPRETTS